MSQDPQPDVEAWFSFADYCVARELVLVCSWGPSTTVLTTWHDAEPLDDALQFFLGQIGDDMREGEGLAGTDWVRIVVVVGEPRWAEAIRGALTSLGPHSFEEKISAEEEREIKRECLRRVIQRDGELDELLADMSVTTLWGEDIEVPLRKVDLVGLLEDFLRGEVTADQVAEWAEVLEMRDELEPEDGTFWLLSDLAPPVGAFYPLTRERALSIIQRLR